MVDNHIKSNRKPTEAERRLQVILDKHFPMEWEYVGDGQLKIGGKCPDFVSSNGSKKLLEMFGNYWYTFSEVDTRIKYFAKFGYSCCVIWEEELNNEDALIRHILDNSLYIPKYPGLGIIHWGRVPQYSMAICEYCGKEYPKCRELQRFCSNRCRMRWWVKQYYGRDSSYGETICPICRMVFTQTRPWNKYCSNTCRREGNRIYARNYYNGNIIPETEKRNDHVFNPSRSQGQILDKRIVTIYRPN